MLTYFTLDETLTEEQRTANRNYNRGGIGLTDIMRNAPLMLILIVLGMPVAFALGLGALALAGRLPGAVLREYDCNHFQPYYPPLFDSFAAEQADFLAEKLAVDRSAH